MVKTDRKADGLVKTDKKTRVIRGGLPRGVGAAGAGVPEGARWVLEAAAGGAGLGVGGERKAVGEDQRAGGRVVAVSRRVGAGASRVGGDDEVLGGGEVCGCRAGRKVMAGGQRGADGRQATRQ